MSGPEDSENDPSTWYSLSKVEFAEANRTAFALALFFDRSRFRPGPSVTWDLNLDL